MKKLLTIIFAFVCLLAFAQLLPETEPNNNQATAQNIMLKDSITGLVSSDTDQDWYKITLDKGAYFMALNYPQGNPGWADWWDLLLTSGDVVEHMCYYPMGQNWTYFKVCQPNTVIYVRFQKNQMFGLTNSPYQFTILADTEDPKECNDTPQTAQKITEPTLLTGKIALPGDEDYIEIQHVAAGPFSATVNNSTVNLPFDLTLYATPGGTPIATSFNNGLQASIPSSLAGTLYLKVNTTNPDTSSMFPYALSIVYIANASCPLTVDSTAVVLDTTLCGQSTGTITLPTPTDGIPPFNYTINGGASQSSPVFTNVGEGTYEVTVSDVAGCSSIFSVSMPCTSCQSPVVGVVNAIKTGKTVTLNLTQIGNPTLSYNWGDGTTSTGVPTHTYTQNGTYNIQINASNNCGSSVSTVEVTVLSGTFQAGIVEGVVGDTILVPVYSVNYEGQITYVLCNENSDISVGKFLGVVPAKLAITNDFLNPQTGEFTSTFGTIGTGIGIGDTLFYLKYVLTGAPGDSSGVDLNEGGIIYFGSFITPNSLEFQPEFITGGFKIKENVPVTVEILSMQNQPVTHVEVTLITPDTTITGFTGQDGKFSAIVPYTDSITVVCKKDTVVKAGITPNDAFYIQRKIVGLLVTFWTDYSWVAANWDCGAMTPNDVVRLLRWIVGLEQLACPPQLVFIPSDYVFPAYGSPGFYNYPTQKIIVNPNPNGELVGMRCVVKGDVDGTASPGFTSGTEDRGTVLWHYTESVHENSKMVNLTTAESIDIANGMVEFDFNRTDYVFEGAQFLQAGDAPEVITNEDGESLKMAFVNKHGNDFEYDHNLPLIALKFRSKGLQVSDLGLHIVEKTFPSLTVSAVGEQYNVTLERQDAPSTVTVQDAHLFPNPANSTVLVSLGTLVTGAVQMELFDVNGKLVTVQAIPVGQFSMTINTSEFPEGIYFCRVVSAGEIQSIQKLIIAH